MENSYRVLNEDDIESIDEYKCIFSKKDSDQYKKERLQKTWADLIQGKYRFSIVDTIDSEVKSHKIEKISEYENYTDNNFFEQYKNIYIDRKKIIIDKITSPELYELFAFFSEIREHVGKGCYNETNFISTTTSFETLKKYYFSQKISKVAVIKKIQNRDMYDINSENFFKAISLTEGKIVDNLCFIFNQINDDNNNEIFLTPTTPGSTIRNYSVGDSEELHFFNIEQKEIVSIITPLEIDLVDNGIFPEDYLNSDNETIEKNKNNILNKTHEIIQYHQNCEILNYIIDEHYINCKSFLSLACESKYSMNDLIEAKKELIKIINNKVLKKNELEKIKIPEDINNNLSNIGNLELDLIYNNHFNYFEYYKIDNYSLKNDKKEIFNELENKYNSSIYLYVIKEYYKNNKSIEIIKKELNYFMDEEIENAIRNITKFIIHYFSKNKLIINNYIIKEEDIKIRGTENLIIKQK